MTRVKIDDPGRLDQFITGSELPFADDLGPAKVIHVHEPTLRLEAVLVVDNVACGPSIGGLRMAPDVSTEECVRLARAMTLKNAAAGLPHGGGKPVLRGDAGPRCHRGEDSREHDGGTRRGQRAGRLAASGGPGAGDGAGEAGDGLPPLLDPVRWASMTGWSWKLGGFPLDGGRVLRAAVWAWTGSFDRANRAAATAGELLAMVLIGIGVLRAIGGDVAGGTWMALIGWFLQSPVAAGRAEAALRELLRGVTVRQAMAGDCVSVAPELTLDRLVQEEVLGTGRRCFVVAEDGRLRGLLTLNEVKGVPRERWDRAKVEEVMQPVQALSVVGPEEDLLKVLEKMDDAKVAQLPVVGNGHWLGMIDREHILHYMRVRAELGV